MPEWTSDDARLAFVLAGEHNYMLWNLANKHDITPYEMVTKMIETFYTLSQEKRNNGR